MSEKLPILTKNQFKQTSRYLQEQLTKEMQSEIKLSTCQEALCRMMGFNDLHSYQHWLSVTETMPSGTAEYANGDLAKEIQSLRFCLDAAQGDSSGQYKIRTILLHLYNNQWPCTIDLKNLDQNHTIHLLNVLALDARPHHEIHQWAPESEPLFRQWAREAIENLTIPQDIGERFIKFFVLTHDNRGVHSFLSQWKNYGGGSDIAEEIDSLDEEALSRFRSKIEQYF